MKKYLIISLFFILLVAGSYFYVDFAKKKNVKTVVKDQTAQTISEKNQIEDQNIQENQEIKQIEKISKENLLPKIEQDVAFMVQAPFGNWKDPIFQNAC